MAHCVTLSQCLGLVSPLLSTPVPPRGRLYNETSSAWSAGYASRVAEHGWGTARGDAAVQSALAELASSAREAREECATLRSALARERDRNSDLQKALAALSTALQTKTEKQWCTGSTLSQTQNAAGQTSAEEALARERANVAKLLAALTSAYGEVEQLRIELGEAHRRAPAGAE